MSGVWRTECLWHRKILYLRKHTCMFEAVFALHSHTCCRHLAWKHEMWVCSCGLTRQKNAKHLWAFRPQRFTYHPHWHYFGGGTLGVGTWRPPQKRRWFFCWHFLAEIVTPLLFLVSFLKRISGAHSSNKNAVPEQNKLNMSTLQLSRSLKKCSLVSWDDRPKVWKNEKKQKAPQDTTEWFVLS